MLIEYKIKVDKHGLTITQRVEPGSSAVTRTPPPKVFAATANGARIELGPSFAASQAARPLLAGAAGTGDVAPGSTGEGDVAPGNTGEGNVAPGNTGEGGALGTGLTIIFGPIIVDGATAGALGGSNVAPGSTGEGAPTKPL